MIDLVTVARWCMANSSREQLLSKLREAPQSRSSSRCDNSVQLRLPSQHVKVTVCVQAAHEMYTNWHLARRGSSNVGEWAMYRCKTYPEPSSWRHAAAVASTWPEG